MAGIEEIVSDIEKHGEFSFSRSGGPGGQNVNKVNTNVLLTMSISDLEVLSDSERRLVREKLSNRINSNDQLFVQAQQERSQLRNRRLAVGRLAELIAGALFKTAVRKKTRPSRASKERRLNEKKRRSSIKKNRRFSDFE